MSNIPFTQALRTEYVNLFNSCIIRPEHASAVEKIISRILKNKQRYLDVADACGIPWYFIAVIHNMESDMDFSTHLHNGDPLSSRTVNVPAGKPEKGDPPFTWEVSAVDAIVNDKNLGSQTNWSLAGTLYQLERYNGFGYRNNYPHVRSPYMWSFSNHYTAGKYISDHVFSETAVSDQCGSAVLLKRMAEMGQIEFPDQSAPEPGSKPIVVSYTMKKSSDPADVKLAEQLQLWLNTNPGISITIDGVPGKETSTAYKRVTGEYLPGDPRE
jgi:lysozyme family protein